MTARVERIVDPHEIDERDALVSQPVDRKKQPLQIGIVGHVERDDLSGRVHAGVGSARRVHAHGNACVDLDRTLELALHRRLVRLELPPRPLRPEVLDCPAQPHGFKRGKIMGTGTFNFL